MAYYRKNQLQELVHWEEGMVMESVSVSEADKANGSPKVGDMIAFNPKDTTDMWLVSEEFCADNYTYVGDTLEQAGGL